MAERERVTRRYASEIFPIIGPDRDIPAPDMATGEREMAWFMDTYSQQVGHPVPEIVTGKPLALGGTAGRQAATGLGVVFCVESILRRLGWDLEGMRVVVQGFGNVGAVLGRELVERGAVLIGVSDVTGGVVSADGIEIDALVAWVSEHGFVRGFPEGEPVSRTGVLEVPCDILIPAALERQITAENAHRVSCRLLVEAANGPTTPEADAILADSDVFLIPDVLCNAGGVTVSYFEWVQDIQQFLWSEEQVNQKLQELMLRAFHQVIDVALRRKLSMRTAALSLGVQKVAKEKLRRGLFP
jgi:glutamate dehydrogenase (NAD(P)+)